MKNETIATNVIERDQMISNDNKRYQTISNLHGEIQREQETELQQKMQANMSNIFKLHQIRTTTKMQAKILNIFQITSNYEYKNTK